MRLLLLFAVLLSSVAHAQSGGGRTCRILFLGGAEADPEKLYLHDGAGCQEVDLPRLNLSKPYKIPAGERVLRLLSSVPAEGESPAPGAPSAKLPDGSADFYLLVTPDPENKVVAVRLQVIDASADRFRPGQMLWYNLTPHDVGGIVGKERLAVKARSRAILPAPATAAGEYPVNLSYRIAGKEALYPLCETKWSHVPTARTVLFIVNEPGVRTPRVMGFPDHPEQAEKNR